MSEIQKRPIEQYLDVASISEAGTSERYQRASSPHTVFTWWARRPFSTARDLISASLNPAQPAEESKVLDPFVGGATFPLAGTRLGIKMYGMENNELAYFTAKALLDLSRSAGRQLRHLLMLEGRQVLDQLKSETRDLYPARDTDNIICYFWSRSATCTSCGGEMPLQKRPWLSKKAGKQRAIVQQPNFDTKSFDVRIVESSTGTVTDSSAWSGRNSLRCLFCGQEYDRQQTAELIRKASTDKLTAAAQLDKRKHFLPATHPQNYIADSLAEQMVKEDCATLGLQLPDVEIPAWSGITNPTVYGHDTIPSLFTARQLAVTIRLCRILNERQKLWEEKYGDPQSKAISAFLSGLIDQLADWNSRLCMWISQNEQVGRGLSGPGMPMLWDFVEIDPLLGGPANLYGKLERIAAGVDQIPMPPDQEERITRGDSRSMAYPDSFFDAVVTDPPYYDNLYYSILADCIYTFKRMALVGSFPEIFSEPRTDSTRELTAAPRRQGSPGEAWTYFSTGMAQVLRESRRVVKQDGVITVCYAHSSISGWSSLIAAYVRAGLKITQLWPMTIERTHRPRSMKSAAINTSLVLVARPHDAATSMGLGQDSPNIDKVIKAALDRAADADWPDDVAATLAFVSAAEARLRQLTDEVLSHQEAVNSACREVADRIYESIPGFSFSSR
ncbi:DUF1156 domain-containing protein [Streptomyces sp. SID8382]|uniref:DUF1156 domain-containing protein n=1 Tax=Streptomyces malaysiensis TaxID=92644 RepID=UPI000C2CC975|nr:DUF1156 domain-containing protein [Streptomyces sp. M56]AUA14109.1 DNA methylase [Streptomyces sp. M56]MYX57020.1 DUF1156 domain-containing protein [Streptomyces sp. SID8382]MYX59385.1 DUF1156 domain-containing protein [Streptomyces sp. SID8382]